MSQEMIVIVDFGGQYNQLIARRVRESNVYCVVKPYTTPFEELMDLNPKGFIFTGGPDSVYLPDSPHPDTRIFSRGIPILGICYGCQLLSHHLGGLVKCLNSFEVSNVFGPDYVHTSNLFNTFMNTATANAIIVQYPSVGETFDFGTGSFTVLAPNGISQNSNDNSLVIKLENGSNSFVFTGDAEETSEQDMISTGMNLDCDVLSVGHHGSASSTTWDFLEATSPSYAVISCGINNQYNHPSADTMGRLSDMGIPVFRTDKQGTIIAVSDGTNISWSQEPCNDYSSGMHLCE